MMNETDQPQPPCRRRETILGTEQRQPVDYRRGGVGQARERRANRRARNLVGVGEAAGELDRLNVAPTCAQSIDDAAVEQIAAGQLIETAGNQKGQRRQAIAPSNASQATGDSRSTTRSVAIAPAVPGPSAPLRIRVASRRKISPARNSVVVLRPRKSVAS